MPTPLEQKAAVNGGPSSVTRAQVSAHCPDRNRVRGHATRAAPHYDAAAWLPRRVADALMEHLQPVRIEPRRILDVGAGTGICSRRLASRYRRARVVCVDSSPAMLSTGRGRRWLSRRALACGDAEALPLADASVDLLVSSLMLPSCAAPDAVLAEFRRVLAPGGLLMIATLGPDTLQELRAAWQTVDSHVHVHAFIDMHDLGDALLRAGLSDVVMDSERITARYRDVATLLAELKRLGAGNAARGGRAGLTTPSQLAAMRSAYETRRREALLPASFEIVYGHAWRAPARSVEVAGDALLGAVRRAPRG